MTGPTPEPSRRGSRSPLVWVLAGLLLGGGCLMYSDLRGHLATLAQRIQDLDTRVQAQNRTLQLYRFEQQSKAGLGFPALLEQIRFWAPQASITTTPQVQVPVIEERLTDVCDAIKALGPSVFDELATAFAAAQPGVDYEVRRWLLRAMVEVDRARAVEFLETVLLGCDHRLAPRLRLFAAEQLTALDRQKAADVLKQILTTESDRGLDPERLPPDFLQKHPRALEYLVPYRGFSNFVQRYVATGLADDKILLRILNRWRDFDLMTLQEAVKSLGTLRCPEAIDPIKQLFENPPREFTPMFRNYCLDAIASIQGPAGCEYFKDALRREKSDIVIAKLTDLIKRTCE